MTPFEPEHRICERIPIEGVVDLETENNFYTGLSRDVSMGGVFIATHVPPPVGTDVLVQLVLPGDEVKLQIAGVVRWIRSLSASCEGMPPGCGISWVALPASTTLVIARFVQSRDSLFFED